MSFIKESISDTVYVVSLVVSTLFGLILLIVLILLCAKSCNKRKRRHSNNSDAETEVERRNCSSTVVKLQNGEGDRNQDGQQNGRPLSHDRALPEIPAASSGITSTDDDEEEDEGHYDFISRGKKASLTNRGNSASVASCASTANDGTSSMKVTALKPVRSHPYEKVAGDTYSDPTYAGVKGDSSGESGGNTVPPILSAPISGPPSHLVYPSTSTNGASHPVSRDHSQNNSQGSAPANAEIAGMYSVIGGNHTEGVVGGRRAARNKGLGLPGTTNLPELPNLHSAPGLFAGQPPPVPDKRYSSGTEESIASPPGSLHGGGASQPSSSPSLPPRNGDSFCGGSPTVWNNMEQGTVNGAAAASTNRGLFGSTAGASSMGAFQWNATADQFPLIDADVTDGLNDTVGNVPSTSAGASAITKRVPDYSSVSARESLENLRKRQQQQTTESRRATLPDLVEGTYDTIDYDKIKTPASGAPGSGSEVAGASGTENVYSNGSDLYAEIGTGQNSARSSTYARVGSVACAVGLADRDMAASTRPVPPSVDTLQQLTHLGSRIINVSSSDADDITDPGYSRLNSQGSRPSSMSNTTQPTTTTSISMSQPAAPALVSSVQRSPVYSVINKSAQNHRQTVHVDFDVGRNHTSSTIGHITSHSGLRASAGGQTANRTSHAGVNGGYTEPLTNNVYAQVDRSRTHRRSNSNDPSWNGGITSIPTNSASNVSGARFRTIAGQSHEPGLFKFGNGRDGADNLDNVKVSLNTNSDRINDRNNINEVSDDPDYDVVPDDSVQQNSPLDHNYEIAISPTITPNGGIHYSSSRTASMQRCSVPFRMPVTHGFACEISPDTHLTDATTASRRYDNGVSPASPTDRPAMSLARSPPRREHIYEVVSESTRQNAQHHPWDRTSDVDSALHRPRRQQRSSNLDSVNQRPWSGTRDNNIAHGPSQNIGGNGIICRPLFRPSDATNRNDDNDLRSSSTIITDL